MSQNTGVIKQVMGPVVDVEFADGGLPEIYTALHVSNKLYDTKYLDECELRYHSICGANLQSHSLYADGDDGRTRSTSALETGRSTRSFQNTCSTVQGQDIAVSGGYLFVCGVHIGDAQRDVAKMEEP